MSFSDAIGQIDQIVQWEQQLANPAAMTQAASSGGTAAASETSSTSAGDAAASSSFSDALAQAQSQEGGATSSLLDPASAATGSASDLLSGGDSQLLTALSSTGASDTGGSSSLLSALESQLASGSAAGTSGMAASTATSADDPRIAAMVQEANGLVGKPYVWGGGHSGWGPQTGYDCSGFVSAVLHAGGYLSSPADTVSLPSQAGIEQGPGQYVTIYDRTGAGENGHVIIEINGQFYESGGESGSWGGGGGVAKIATPPASYLSTFNAVLHPAGL